MITLSLLFLLYAVCFAAPAAKPGDKKAPAPPAKASPAKPAAPDAAWRARMNAAEAAMSGKDFAGAEKAYDAAAREAAKLGRDDARAAESLAGKADALRGQGRHPQAVEAYIAAIDLMGKTMPEDDLRLAKAYDGLSSSLEAKNLPEDAAKMGLKAARIYATVYGPVHLEVARSAERLAGLSVKSGNVAQAIAYYQQALLIREKLQGPEHPDLLPILEPYSQVLALTPRKEDARKMAERAKALKQKLAAQEQKKP